jgi:nitroreductase
MQVDVYQQRYLAHQARKKLMFTNPDEILTDKFRRYSAHEQNALFSMMESRRSQRIFNKESITEDEVKTIYELIRKSPSSCDRQAIISRIVETRDHKDLLSGLLVGGIGWIHRADKIFLLFADMRAYKSESERKYMPYLDAGVVVQQTYLACEAMNIGCCYVNPNIREKNEGFFKERFAFDTFDYQFCGALALGKYDKKIINPHKHE